MSNLSDRMNSPRWPVKRGINWLLLGAMADVVADADH